MRMCTRARTDAHINTRKFTEGITHVFHSLFTRCYTKLKGVTWYYTVLHSAAGCYMVLHGVKGCYTVLEGVTLCYM